MSRLVIIARKLDRGGAERQLVTLASRLRARGRDVHVLLFYEGGAFDGDLAAAGVPIYHLNKRGRWDAVGFLARFRGALAELSPTVVYSFLDFPNILSVVFRGAAGRPRLVWSVRAADMEMRHYDWVSRILPVLEARLSGAADAIVANSHAGAAWARRRGFPVDRLSVIENGIATDLFHPDPDARKRVRDEWKVGDDETLIGLVGRLDPMKDHPNFLRACAELASTRTRLRFVCVGAGSDAYRGELAALSERLGLAPKLIWGGGRRDMPAVTAALDLACSASSFGEGFSNTVGEAMACGVPCAVTDVGDSARIVGDLGETAPPRDPSGLARAITRLLERMAAEPSLSARARDRIVRRFSVETMVDGSEAVLFGPDLAPGELRP